MIRVEVYPEFSPLYHSYYLEGILNKFGTKSIRFTTRGFPNFEECGLAIRIPSLQLRVFVDALDWDDYDNKALNWCNVYAKVNFNLEKTAPDYMNRVLPIGPNFGIKLRNRISSFVQFLFNNASHFGSIRNWVKFYKDYRSQINERLLLSAYYPGEVDPNYIFHLSSIWDPSDSCNHNRIEFIKAASLIKGVHFEGGFSPPARADVPECIPFIMERMYPLREYLSKIRRSVVVFNTPAVLDCHGWKLGEYLAMGKAIISTPLSREVPEPLIHGEHLHIVNGTYESIKEAIELIRSKSIYRKHLERNGYLYFLRYLHPHRVIDRIISHGAMVQNLT